MKHSLKRSIENSRILDKSRPEPWLDKSLEDIPGEEWIDIEEFAGVYLVSNFGRVKGVDRRTNNCKYVKGVAAPFDTSKHVKAKILSQFACKSTGVPMVTLSWNGVVKNYSIAIIVGKEFLGEKKDNEVYCHENKIKTNNRLYNVIKISRSASCKIDFETGVKTDWGFSEIAKNERKEYLKKNGIYENGVLVGIVCIGCKKPYPLEDFYLNQGTSSENRSRFCKICNAKKAGVKNIGKLSERKALAAKGLRYCSICKKLKTLDKDFSNLKGRYLGKNNTCKDCNYDLHAAYSKDQKENIGDFYVKQYALRNYGLRISGDDIDKYRKEIIKNRKPKYFVDDKSFVTKKDFAKYIHKIYNISVEATLGRLRAGKSEEECKMSENEIRSLACTKGKIKVTDTVTGQTYLFKNTRDEGLLKMFSTSARDKAIKTGEATRVTKVSKYNNPCRIERI